MELKQNMKPVIQQGEEAITMLILRIIIGGLLSGAVLIGFHTLLSNNQRSSGLSAQSIIVGVISGLLYVAIMAPLARQASYRPFPRFLAIFIPLYITGTLTDLIEAYFYTTLLTPFRLIAALILEGIPILVIAGIIVWLIPASEEARGAPSFSEVMRERSFFSWLWRIVAAGVPYALIYLFFAALVTPIEHAYYNDPAFIASLHTRVPSTTVTIILEAARGILFVIAQFPVIAVLRKSRWTTGLYIGLMGAVIEGWIPLLGMITWPVMMRVGNFLELTGDAFGRALLIALFVALPYLDKKKPE